MDNTFNIAELIAKKNLGKISDEELKTLENWVNSSAENAEVYTKSTDTKNLLEKYDTFEQFDKDDAWQKLENKTFGKKINLFSRNIIRYAAAVIIPVFLLSGLAYLYFSKPEQATIATINEHIKPGTQQAVLTLSDGKTIELSSLAEHESLKEKGVNISRTGNKLAYSDDSQDNHKELVYNELKTPYGGEYNLTLADGTEIWLNAGSSLKFPVEFSDSTRQVFLEGEAYFEVAHNGKPFIVNSGSVDIRVLGTSFNVSAYSNDADIVTTLVEGKVRVEIEDDTESKTTTLSPNMQAVFSKDNTNLQVEIVNTRQYTSWKEGQLEFNNENLEMVMRKLSRWYDFEFNFENDAAMHYHFTARFSNKEKISSILEMLEMTTEVKFEIKEENTIVIK